MRNLALIGGGAASVLFAAELVEAAHAGPLTLHWFCGEQGDDRGVAYATSESSHLLNVRASGMDNHHALPPGFLDFARGKDPRVLAGDFLPRGLFGEYLQARVSRTQVLAKARGVRIHRHPCDALAISRAGEHDYSVLDSADTVTDVDGIVLAVGALPPRSLPQVSREALRARRYVVDPWPWLGSAHDEVREVAVIGAGLTAVDVALAIAERYPQARIHLISRHGRLPAAHAPTPAAMAAPTAAQLTAYVRDPRIGAWMSRIRHEMRQASDWRSVIDALRAVTPLLWMSLPTNERERFLRHARWAWDLARHRMPPDTAAIVHGMQREGRLTLTAARLQGTALHGQRLALHLRGRAEFATQERVVDYALQACGMDTDLRASSLPLFDILIRSGLAVPDPLGLGVVTVPEGLLLQANGIPAEQFWAIGAMRRGTQWESTAIPEIRHQARSIAQSVHAAAHSAAAIAAHAPHPGRSENRKH